MGNTEAEGGMLRLSLKGLRRGLGGASLWEKPAKGITSENRNCSLLMGLWLSTCSFLILLPLLDLKS